MENGLLYTFSTIAQAVAAGFALIGAFVLYRLQSLENSMVAESAGLVGRGIFTNDEEMGLRAYRDRRRFGSFLSTLIPAVHKRHERLGDQEPNGPWSAEDMQHITSIVFDVDMTGMMHKKLWVSLWITGVTMLYSTALIPFAHLLAHYAWIAWSSAVFGILLFALCLLAYAILIISSLPDPGRITIFDSPTGGYIGRPNTTAGTAERTSTTPRE